MITPKQSLLRTWAEKLSRGKMFSRRLQTPQGPRRLHVTPEASLVYWLPNSLNRDRPLCAFANSYIRPGSRVWDIGANIGIFTFLAAAQSGKTGHVLTVEADPFISQLLIKTAVNLPATDAAPQIVTAAVSDSICLANFAVVNRSRASSHLLTSTGCTQTGGVRFSFKVPCLTLDWLLENTFQPEIVKMDIEGIESIALAAAPRLLSEARPTFHLEVWSEISAELKTLFEKHAYLFFDGETDLTLTKQLDHLPWCTIAVPSEKLEAVRASRNG